jgi:hypothetical protein
MASGQRKLPAQEKIRNREAKIVRRTNSGCKSIHLYSENRRYWSLLGLLAQDMKANRGARRTGFTTIVEYQLWRETWHDRYSSCQ